MQRDELDQALLAAHADHDIAELVRLYTVAADTAEADDDVEAANFYLTHAFVFALEGGAPEAAPLNRRLAARGCARLLEF